MSTQDIASYLRQIIDHYLPLALLGDTEAAKIVLKATKQQRQLYVR